jgi:hypothetical protein
LKKEEFAAVEDSILILKKKKGIGERERERLEFQWRENWSLDRRQEEELGWID